MQTQEELIKEGTEKGEELLTKVQIKDSPFVVVEEKGKFYGLVGKYRLTEECDTREKAIEETTKMTWDNLIKVMIVIQDMGIEINKLKTVE